MAFGGPQMSKIGEARGNIFINPFAEPGEVETVVTKTIGRILNGGVVTQSQRLQVLLDNPSHSKGAAGGFGDQLAIPGASGR